jgi:hypothetical protein
MEGEMRGAPRSSGDLVMAGTGKEDLVVTPKNVEHIFVYKDAELAHAVNQTSMIALQNGEILMGFNEERYPRHSDSGQSCFIKSKDGERHGTSLPRRWFGPTQISGATGTVPSPRSPTARF